VKAYSLSRTAPTPKFDTTSSKTGRSLRISQCHRRLLVSKQGDRPDWSSETYTFVVGNSPSAITAIPATVGLLCNYVGTAPTMNCASFNTYGLVAPPVLRANVSVDLHHMSGLSDAR